MRYVCVWPCSSVVCIYNLRFNGNDKTAGIYHLLLVTVPAGPICHPCVLHHYIYTIDLPCVQEPGMGGIGIVPAR